jgi:hypothetical protein
MTTRIRTLLLLATITTLVAACGTATAAPESEAPMPSEPAVPSVEPSAPAEPSEAPVEAPAEEREVDGIITVVEGMAFSGPGGTIQKTLEIGASVHPALVNGILFRDTDGTIYLATSVSDASAPTFDGPMLLVLNLDNTGSSWDMANAELLGLEEANGIVFNQNAQILGFLEVK